MKRSLILAAAVLLVAAWTVSPVEAGPLNAWGRHLGWGWSDGYHSRPYYSHGYHYHVHPGSRSMPMSEPGIDEHHFGEPGAVEYLEPIPQGANGPLLPPPPVAPADDNVAPGEDAWLPGTLPLGAGGLSPEAWRRSRRQAR